MQVRVSDQILSYCLVSMSKTKVQSRATLPGRSKAGRFKTARYGRPRRVLMGDANASGHSSAKFKVSISTTGRQPIGEIYAVLEGRNA